MLCMHNMIGYYVSQFDITFDYENETQKCIINVKRYLVNVNIIIINFELRY